jgi:hypothetical protein
MLEYLWLLGFWREPIWGFNSLWEILTVIFSGLALIFVGYTLKGAWGAFITIGIGAFFYLYTKGLLPF